MLQVLPSAAAEMHGPYKRPQEGEAAMVRQE